MSEKAIAQSHIFFAKMDCPRIQKSLDGLKEAQGLLLASQCKLVLQLLDALPDSMLEDVACEQVPVRGSKNEIRFKRHRAFLLHRIFDRANVERNPNDRFAFVPTWRNPGERVRRIVELCNWHGEWVYMGRYNDNSIPKEILSTLNPERLAAVATQAENLLRQQKLLKTVA